MRAHQIQMHPGQLAQFADRDAVTVRHGFFAPAAVENLENISKCFSRHFPLSIALEGRAEMIVREGKTTIQIDRPAKCRAGLVGRSRMLLDQSQHKICGSVESVGLD